MTRAARVLVIACDSRKQKLYRLNRPLGEKDDVEEGLVRTCDANTKESARTSQHPSKLQQRTPTQEMEKIPFPCASLHLAYAFVCICFTYGISLTQEQACEAWRICHIGQLLPTYSLRLCLHWRYLCTSLVLVFVLRLRHRCEIL